MKQKTNYEAEFCGRVPLNQTNMIQPHGVLLVVDRKDYRIIQCSENATALFNLPPKELVGQSLLRQISEQQGQALIAQFQKEVREKLPFILTFPSGDHLVLIQAREDSFILEIENRQRRDRENDSFLSVYQPLKYAMAAVESATSTQEVCNVAATALKNISGFDKVMIYQFDEAWNGDVRAEAMEPGMDAYLGLKFPSSDIPRQARELYRRSPFRLIPDIHYQPVKLYPVINPLVNAFTDLSDSNLRSVAPVHLEYLSNMGVIASMSTRILVEGNLWGLIACHHRTPRYLSFEICALFELLSTVLSTRISALQKQEVLAYKSSRTGTFQQLAEETYRINDLVRSLMNHQASVLQILGADGAAIVMDGEVNTIGDTPEAIDITSLVLWLQSAGQGRTFHHASLRSVFAPAETYADRASGILALPVHAEKGAYILAFRKAARHTVNWGGNPNDAIRFEPGGKNYHPRHSFQLWQQTVEDTAIAWRPEELEMAEEFRKFTVEFALNRIYT